MSGKNSIEASDVRSKKKAKTKEVSRKYREKVVLDPDSKTWMARKAYKLKEDKVVYLQNPMFTLSDKERACIREENVFPSSFFKKLVCDGFYRKMKRKANKLKHQRLCQAFKDDEDTKNQRVVERTKLQNKERAVLMESPDCPRPPTPLLQVFGNDKKKKKSNDEMMAASNDTSKQSVLDNANASKPVLPAMSVSWMSHFFQQPSQPVTDSNLNLNKQSEQVRFFFNNKKQGDSDTDFDLESIDSDLDLNLDSNSLSFLFKKM